MGLYEELAERFPSEMVEPFGEVVIVPAKSFKSEWKEQLEKENVKIYVSNYGAQSCFFLRKKEVKEQGLPMAEATVESPKPERHRRAWTQEEFEELKRLVNQGLSREAIAEKLGRTKRSISERIKELRKGESEKTRQNEQLNASDSLFKELASALNVLYPQHKRVCLLLLERLEELLKE